MATARADAHRPDVLYLVHRVPYPPDKGDRIRAFHILRYLSGRARVHLACLADEPVAPEAVTALRGYCARVAVVRLRGWSRWRRALASLAWGGTATEGMFSSRELRAVLRQWSGDARFQVALASSSGMVPYLRLPCLREVPGVVDLVDVDSQKWFDYAAAGRGPKAWLYRLEGRRLRRLEQTLPTWTRAVTLVSQAEADLYRRFCDDGVVRAIGNGVNLDYFQPHPQGGGQACVFVGALDYRPNVDAACWFCREVWPEIHRQRAGARMWLVGRRPASAVRRLAELPGVELIGQVPDVRPHLAGAAVALSPLRIARGLQNKVLEALAMSRATVVSPQALEGLQARPGVHLLTAGTPGEWVTAILSLLDDPARRQQLGEAGRRYVETHHSWDDCLKPFGPLLGLRETRGPLPLPSHDGDAVAGQPTLAGAKPG
jgi:sugar transferase (PEP-CTERM/EpsH1 system associated)